MDIEKKLDGLVKRVQYARDILGDAEDRRLTAFANKLEAFLETSINKTQEELWDKLNTYDESLAVLEKDIDKTLSAMDKVRIVRHSERICLEDILENVYDNYTVVGGKDDMSIDPGMVIARAYITRRVGKSPQPAGYGRSQEKATVRNSVTAAASSRGVMPTPCAT